MRIILFVDRNKSLSAGTVQLEARWVEKTRKPVQRHLHARRQAPGALQGNVYDYKEYFATIWFRLACDVHLLCPTVDLPAVWGGLVT